ncbi:MAG: DUF1015 domain-containing protein [Kiritimatiellaeota bacterium]|nr:DUF1015 domain-containing protein [Kiritimatiellota bacterium]
MSVFAPFHGLTPDPDKAELVAAVPYDVVNTEEAAALAEGNPLSFLRVSRPEIELDPGMDLHDDKVYAKAAENFKRLCETAPLTLDSGEHLYVYALQMGEHRQIGMIGVASTEDYENDIIKKHEKTRKDKEDDRTRHVMILRSHTGPVFMTYKDSAAIDAKIADAMSASPTFDFTAPDGIRHTVWRIDEQSSVAISEDFKSVPCLYIADGHHRAASAARTAKAMRSQSPSHTGQEDYNYFLAVSFPASQLRILPYNRAVADLNGLSKETFLEALSAEFAVAPAKSPETEIPGDIRMYLDGEWFHLEPKFDLASLGVIESLDVSVLQDHLLGPVLGIDDPRTSQRVDFIGGIRGTSELEKLVDGGKMMVAFSMYPTTVEQLMAIADAGEIMPPKSTWFEPKLRDGLVCHNF